MTTRVRFTENIAKLVADTIKAFRCFNGGPQVLKGKDKRNISYTRLSAALNLYAGKLLLFGEGFYRMYLSGLVEHDPKFKGVASKNYLLVFIQALKEMIETLRDEVGFRSGLKYKDDKKQIELFLEKAEKVLNSPRMFEEWCEPVGTYCLSS
ncbi:MAG: hypothetical protein AAF959_18570 [Cyanobacteria bacterium P01_D01_bin.56]